MHNSGTKMFNKRKTERDQHKIQYIFNLLKLKPSFEMTKNMNIKTRTKFNRKISFKKINIYGKTLRD